CSLDIAILPASSPSWWTPFNDDFLTSKYSGSIHALLTAVVASTQYLLGVTIYEGAPPMFPAPTTGVYWQAFAVPSTATESPMPNITPESLQPSIQDEVRRALAEDVGSGDITAALIPADRQARATIISREPATLCGTAWADEVFRQVDPQISVEWLAADGDRLEPNQPF